jgi:hypothetical protein
VCGCGDPLLASSDPAAITGQLRLQLDTEYLRVDAANDENPLATDKLSQWSYRLGAAYRPFESLSLSVTVPLVSKSIRTEGGGDPATLASDLTGLGDIELAARYSAWRSVNLARSTVHELALTGGSTLPTGSYNATTPDGAIIDPHGQLGTGGWGPFVGLSYRYEHTTPRGEFDAFANVSYRYRSEATYNDASKYKFGDAVLWSVHGQYRPMRRLALDLGIDGRYAMRDRATADTGDVNPFVEGTGGTVLAAAPGVYFNATGALWIFARGQIPFYKHLLENQNVLPSFTTGIQFQAL